MLCSLFMPENLYDENGKPTKEAREWLVSDTHDEERAKASAIGFQLGQAMGEWFWPKYYANFFRLLNLGDGRCHQRKLRGVR